MRKLWDLARNTFRESIRDRVLTTGLVFAVLLLGFSLLLGSLSIGQDIRIIRDMGLGAVEAFCVAIVVFIAASSLHRELDRRTLFIVLAKPVSRSDFILGKFLGLAMTATALLGILAVAFTLILLLVHGFQPVLLCHLALLWIQLLVLVAGSLLFASFASPVMTMTYMASLYFIGHNMETLKDLAARATPVGRLAIDVLYYTLPNLAHLDLKGKVVYGVGISPLQWLLALCYGMVYVAFSLIVANLLFQRREL